MTGKHSSMLGSRGFRPPVEVEISQGEHTLSVTEEVTDTSGVGALHLLRADVVVDDTSYTVRLSGVKWLDGRPKFPIRQGLVLVLFLL